MNVRKLLRLDGGGEVEHRGNPGGAALHVDHIQSLIARGYGRWVTVGAFTTGIVGGGAGTVFDLDQPEFAIAVPAGTAIRPFHIGIQVQTGLIAADNDENEILVAVDSKGMWTGDGTSTAEIPSNLRTDLATGSACRVGSAFTADMTTTNIVGTGADPVLDIELARVVSQIDVSTAVGVNYKVDSLLYQPLYAPLLVGPCTILGYWGGTVANIGGFAQIGWVEAPIAEWFTR